MSAKIALWREVIKPQTSFNAAVLKDHLAEINKFHPEVLSHISVTKADDNSGISLAYGNEAHGLYGETVVIQAGISTGAWIGRHEDRYVLVCWDAGIVQYEIVSNTPEAVAAILLPDDISLFYTDVDKEALEVCFKNADATELKIKRYVALESIDFVTGRFLRKESILRRVLLGIFIISLLIAMFFYFTRTDIVVVQILHNPLGEYQASLRNPTPATILNEMQQAYWFIDDLGGWTLESIHYKPTTGITLNLTNPEPHQDYLYRWLEARPFEVKQKDSNNITLTWSNRIDKRPQPTFVALNQNQHLWMMDKSQSWNMRYSNSTSTKDSGGYVIETISLVIKEPTRRIFDVLDWLLAHHKDTVLESVSLSYKDHSWLGKAQFSLLMKIEKDLISEN